MPKLDKAALQLRDQYPNFLGINFDADGTPIPEFDGDPPPQSEINQAIADIRAELDNPTEPDLKGFAQAFLSDPAINNWIRSLDPVNTTILVGRMADIAERGGGVSLQGTFFKARYDALSPTKPAQDAIAVLEQTYNVIF